MSRPIDRNLVLVGDARECLRRLPAESVHCVVTSPPYLGLRSYGTPPQVWGGDLACAHAWGTRQAAVRERSTNGRADLGSTLDGAGGPKLLALGAATPDGPSKQYWVDESAVCERCGAWKGHLGLEKTLDAYVEHLVEVFREIRRVLCADGTVWLNIGDSFAANRGCRVPDSKWRDVGDSKPSRVPPGPKPKDLQLVPFRVALALQADGWWIRADIVFAKPNPMPESVLDRPTRAHEYIFLLAKSETYFYDSFAVREPDVGRASGNVKRKVADGADRGRLNTHLGSSVPYKPGGGRNLRDVLTITPRPYKGAHFAAFPAAIPEIATKAGTSEAGCCAACGAPLVRQVVREKLERPVPPKPNGRDGGLTVEHGLSRAGISHFKVNEFLAANPPETIGWRRSCACDAPTVPCVVLDPFLGSGTTAMVAADLGRRFVGIELNEKYIDLIRERIGNRAPFEIEGLSSPPPRRRSVFALTPKEQV